MGVFMQCPRCGATNSENHAACWKCFAQLSSAPSGKPQEIKSKANAPVEKPTTQPEPKVEPAQPVVAAEPVQAAPPTVAEPAPVVEPAPVAQPAPPQEAVPVEEDMFSFLNARPEEEPEAVRPSNAIDLDEPSGGVDITRFMVPELAEKDEKPHEGPESKH